MSHQQIESSNSGTYWQEKMWCLKYNKLSFYKLSNLVIILLLLTKESFQQQQQNKTETLDRTNLIPQEAKNQTNSTIPEVIISAEEFIDFTEAPTILFDGTLNDSNQTETNSTSTLKKLIEPSATTINPNDKSNVGEDSSELSGEEGDEEGDDNSSDSKLTDDGKEPFKPPQNVSQYMEYIERLFRDLRHQITDLFEPHIPQLIRTSQMVQLSSSCSYDMLKLALALRAFEPWALRMIDSSGKMPEGIFEGSFTALGSYDECINTHFPIVPSSASEDSDSDNNNNNNYDNNNNKENSDPITQGKYCLVNLSPYLPPKPPADRVEIMFQDEANRRNYTKDNQFSRLSPMFYYMKFRIGVCVPSSCLDSDLDSISNALSSSLRLNITIPHCKVNEQIPVTKHQLIGGFIFGLVVLIVVASTMMDYSKKKMNKTAINRKLMIVRRDVGVALRVAPVINSKTSIEINTKPKNNGIPIIINNPRLKSKDEFSDSDDEDSSTNGDTKEDSLHLKEKRIKRRGKFANRLSKNWTWMSFSLITNYKLYFENKTIKLKGSSSKKLNNKMDKTSNKRNQCPLENHKSHPEVAGGRGCNYYNDLPNTHSDDMRASSCSRSEKQQQQQPLIINCLNGIRVLSLCWVIIANSYITLDPRATKRLTKTREAPKDFLFQLVVQASLAIETFFFLSGVLMSLSFARKLKPTRDSIRVANQLAPSSSSFIKQSGTTTSGSRQIQASFAGERNPEDYSSISAQNRKHEPVSVNNKDNNRKTSEWSVEFKEAALKWFHFYVHRYIRMTPATMLVIAFTMFAFRYGDGPLWIETTQKAHSSCNENWWRHLLHVANFIDTRQMCFIHYWYVAADMQLFLFAPFLLLILYKYRRIGYTLILLIGLTSVANVSYVTYSRNLPPTLLFYNSDPESRREFGNTIMTKPLTHVLPYIVGMLVGKWLSRQTATGSDSSNRTNWRMLIHSDKSLRTLFGLTALIVALGEVFLPYRWNNSKLPTRLLASIYAATFRLAWSLTLAYLVISCRHRRGKRCRQNVSHCCCRCCSNSISAYHIVGAGRLQNNRKRFERRDDYDDDDIQIRWCFCGSGGNLLNRLLSLNIFANLSKLSFVAYLIHLPLMSVFIAQTRSLFAFSHILVLHLALSYLLMTFILSFILVHIIEFPFITLERYLFEKLFYSRRSSNVGGDGNDSKRYSSKHKESGAKLTNVNECNGSRGDNGSSQVVTVVAVEETSRFVNTNPPPHHDDDKGVADDDEFSQAKGTIIYRDDDDNRASFLNEKKVGKTNIVRGDSFRRKQENSERL